MSAAEAFADLARIYAARDAAEARAVAEVNRRFAPAIQQAQQRHKAAQERMKP